MLRRKFIQQSALAFGALSLTHQQLFAGLFQQPWKLVMLSEQAGYFTERGGTIAFLLSGDGIVVVDTQFPDQSQHLIEEIKKRSENPFRLLINTHHHGDHTAGNIAFKGLVSHVLAHANSRKNQENASKQQQSESKQLYPDQTYTNTWSEAIGKEKITLSYFGAAHTDGDSLVHFENANVVHMGDLMFNRRHPFVDRKAGANMKNWISVLDKAVNKYDQETQFIFGHAGDGYPVTGTSEDLKKFGDYLGRVLQFTEKEIRAGKSKEEILKTTTLPGEKEWEGDGFERPLTAAYEELSHR